jgi:hypothetical protein
MHSVVFYNPALINPSEEGETNATLDDIRATGEAIAAANEGTCYIRDVNYFTGNLELGPNGKLPDSVFLLGEDGGVFDAVRQAFEAVEVPVEETDLHQAEASSEDEDTSEGESPLNELKARATELGINFNPNIGEATLRKRVEAAEKEAEDNGGDA